LSAIEKASIINFIFYDSLLLKQDGAEIEKIAVSEVFENQMVVKHWAISSAGRAGHS
jgi:hypothetical protein